MQMSEQHSDFPPAPSVLNAPASTLSTTDSTLKEQLCPQVGQGNATANQPTRAVVCLMLSESENGYHAGRATGTDRPVKVDLPLQTETLQIFNKATIAATHCNSEATRTHTGSTAAQALAERPAGIDLLNTTNTPLKADVPPAEDATAVGSGIPSTPLTLDDIWPAVLTSSHRTSSISSGDALMDLYNQYMRQGSGTFPHVRRQDSSLSGGLVSGVLHPSGGSLSLLQTPKFLATLQNLTNTPKGFKAGYNSITPRGFSNTPKGLLRLQSLTSQGASAGLSPGLMSLMSGPFRTTSLDKGPGCGQDWLSWPPSASMAAAAEPEATDAHNQRHLQPLTSTERQHLADAAVSCDKQHQHQQGALADVPSVTGWLPLDPGSAAGSAGSGYNLQQQLLHQGTYISSTAPPEAPVLIHGTASGGTEQGLIGACLLHNSSGVQLPIKGTGEPPAVQVLPAAVADTDVLSDEPEQHPYSFMEPHVAAAAAVAARQHRKQVLANSRRKLHHASPQTRVVRKKCAKNTLQMASSFPGHQAALGGLTLQVGGQADEISAEERKSLDQTNRAAVLARWSHEQLLLQQQQQQHHQHQQQVQLAGQHAAAAGASAMQQGVFHTHQQQGMLLQQCHAAISATQQQVATSNNGCVTGAAPAAVEESSSDYSSSDSSDDDSSNISSEDSDLPDAAAAQLAVAAARATDKNDQQMQPDHSLHHSQQPLHSWRENMRATTACHVPGFGCEGTGLGTKALSGDTAAAPLLGQHQQQHTGDQGHSLCAVPGGLGEHQPVHSRAQVNSCRMSSSGMHPLFVPVAATGRYSSGTSDVTALDHQQWTGSGNPGVGIIGRYQSACSSAHGSPDQLPPQQQFLVKDSYRRVVIDPQSSTMTVYPRTKRGRRLGQAPADAQRQPGQQQQQQQPRQPGQNQSSAKQAGSDGCGSKGARMSTGSSVQQQQMPLVEDAKAQQQQQQQIANLVSGSTIALNRPRRRIKPTAAAVAYLADSDCEVQQSFTAGLANDNSDAAGLAAEAEFAGGSDSDLDDMDSDESDDDINSASDDYEPGSKRPKMRRPARTTATPAANAMATKRRRSSATGGPEAAQAAANGSKRTAAAGPKSGSRGGKKSPDFGPGSAAAAKPVIEDTRSRYRGVTRHRRSGRWEAHIWVKELGRQVYLGGYELEEAAAEAYDMAALKCKGQGCPTNFPYERYADLLESLGSMTLEELIMAVRRQSQGFSRGSSNYRGVTAHPSGRWESRIGIPGSRHVYLGLFVEEQEAARAYDAALVRLKGTAAATNYSLGCYQQQLAEHYQMKMAVEEGLVHRELFRRHSGQDFEQWIKLGLSAFDIQLTVKAKDMARADVGTAGETATSASGSAVIRLGSGRMSGDGGDSNGVSPVVDPGSIAVPAAGADV